MPTPSWYLYRLKAISPFEYPYRLKQIINKKIDKFSIGNRNNSIWEDRVFHVINVKKAHISELEEDFPDLKREIMSTSENIVNHTFNIFGIKKNYGNPINWHLDPKTNNSWPPKFWDEINYRDGRTIGGIKFAWELNRLHHLPQLAIACTLSGDSRYKDEIFSQLVSWLESNHYPEGINWIMGIELGIRIVNVTYALKFLGTESLTPDQVKLIIQFISLHGKHLYRYPSKYSSGANHAIAEALGLFAAGLCFPSIKGAEKWKAYGKKVLEKEITRQVYPDGSSFEHSIPYLQFVLDNFLIYYLLCRENNLQISQTIEDRLKSSFNFISSILDRENNYPAIGDGDDGYLLRLWFGKHNNFMSLLNTGAVLFSHPEWILRDAKYDQKTFFLLGKDSKTNWEELRNNKNNVFSRMGYFRNAGLAVINDINKPEILFIGNGGPLGLKPLGGHGHADALSFWLSVGGQPVLIDPGTFLYHSGGKWRAYFRSTSAHNTIRVDCQDQAIQASDFMFKDFYKIIDPYFEKKDERIIWSAGHDGYMRLKDPVFHRREVTYDRKEKKLLIIDNIDCKEKHLIECFYHFHPDCLISEEDDLFEVRIGKSKIRIKVDEKWAQKKVVEGGRDSIGGWYSPCFNFLQKSRTLKLNKTVDSNESFYAEIHLE